MASQAGPIQNGSAAHAASGVELLDGNVSPCACPDCGAPMAVRMWLQTADCWRCGTSIALSMLAISDAERTRSPSQPGPTKTAGDSARTESRRDPRPKQRHPGPRPAESPTTPKESPGFRGSPKTEVATEALADALARIDATANRFARKTPISAPPKIKPQQNRPWHVRLYELLACLGSVAAHLLLLILLALLTMAASRRDDQLRLSLEIDPMRVEGGIPNDVEIIQRVGFEVPIENPLQVEPPPEFEAVVWDSELELGERDPDPNLPEISRIKDALTSDDQYRRMLSARDPRIRTEVIRQEGGTTLTEAAVARALRWIARHQERDGSWLLHAFHQAPGCDGRCSGPGSIRSAPGGTALALQAMLGAGQTHQVGQYRDVVSHGLQFLLASQSPDGDLRGDSRANAGMYVQALAAIVLCDALQMTGDEALREPAQRAIDFIVRAQHDAGGWRYQPGQRGDTSVIGWQLMALHSARAAYLRVPNVTLISAQAYLQSAQTDSAGAYFAYQPGGPRTASMTAEGLLSRMYLGFGKDDPGLQRGIFWLLTSNPPNVRDPNIYYWYYATQAMHHWGDAPWELWNYRMRDVLVGTQVLGGHEDGSWDPISPHGHQGGRLYMTSLACCTLEVYYRHAPLYRKIKLD